MLKHDPSVCSADSAAATFPSSCPATWFCHCRQCWSQIKWPPVLSPYSPPIPGTPRSLFPTYIQSLPPLPSQHVLEPAISTPATYFLLPDLSISCFLLHRCSCSIHTRLGRWPCLPAYPPSDLFGIYQPPSLIESAFVNPVRVRTLSQSDSCIQFNAGTTEAELDMPSRRGMASSLLTLACYLTTIFNAASAQTIVPTAASAQFPACAVSCTILLQAQSLCVPPNVAATNQLTYENCFCQSSYLQPLYGSPDALCTTECTVESDRTLLQTWFKNFCLQVGQGVDPLAATALTTTPLATTVVTVTSYSTPAPGATNTGTQSTSASTAPKSQTWIEGHWRWILMLGVLAVGLALFTWFAIWFKRRHRRKLDEQRAAVSGFPSANEKRDGARSATPELWGPHQVRNSAFRNVAV